MYDLNTIIALNKAADGQDVYRDEKPEDKDITLCPVYLTDLAEPYRSDLERDLRSDGRGSILDKAEAEDKSVVVGYYLALEDIKLHD